jgi:thiamine kinase-like enzyme
MPPQKKSKKNIPAETNREDHHPPQRNEISFVPEPSNTTDQERRAKLEALMKARAEKTAHTQEQHVQQQTHENVDDDDDTIDRELERVQQKIQQLQKDKEKFASQLQAKRKISEKLEQLNKAREQIETIQREIDEMKEQENSSLWQESPHQNSVPARGPPMPRRARMPVHLDARLLLAAGHRSLDHGGQEEREEEHCHCGGGAWRPAMARMKLLAR